MWCVHFANVSLVGDACSPGCRPRAWHCPRACCVWPSRCWRRWHRLRRCASSSACDDAWAKCRRPCCPNCCCCCCCWGLPALVSCSTGAAAVARSGSTLRLSNCKSYLCALRMGCSTCCCCSSACGGCAGCGCGCVCGCDCTLGCIICEYWVCGALQINRKRKAKNKEIQQTYKRMSMMTIIKSTRKMRCKRIQSWRISNIFATIFCVTMFYIYN